MKFAIGFIIGCIAMYIGIYAKDIYDTYNGNHIEIVIGDDDEDQYDEDWD